jgi:putative ABC transport system ATP-binding protein
MIELKDLRVTFSRGTPMETPALRGISLSIPTGQFVTVIGSNGPARPPC